jgi:hemolysin activation/secretion protein
LILRAFFDAGRTINSHPSLAPNEKDATMFGTGVGAELQIFRNLSLRCDWGIALKGTQQTTTGDNRFHLIGTFSF